jgi:hypothetical protein
MKPDIAALPIWWGEISARHCVRTGAHYRGGDRFCSPRKHTTWMFEQARQGSRKPCLREGCEWSWCRLCAARL